MDSFFHGKIFWGNIFMKHFRWGKSFLKEEEIGRGFVSFFITFSVCWVVVVVVFFVLNFA